MRKASSSASPQPAASVERAQIIDSDRARLVEVARLFYYDEMTREQIGKRLHMQGRRVTQLLKQARDYRVVDIRIEGDDYSDVERKLRAKYPHLERAIIVEAGPLPEMRKRWAEAAASYLDELLKARKPKPLHVAVSGNEVMLAMANAMPDFPRPNLFVHVIGLVGNADAKYMHVHPTVVASILAARSGAIPGHLEYATVSSYDLYTPEGKRIEPGTRAALEVVKNEIAKVEKNRSVERVVKNMDKVDVVFAGVGVTNPPDNSALAFTMRGIMGPVIPPDQLEREGAVGDFAYCTYDERGQMKEHWQLCLTAGHYSKERWGVRFFQDMVAHSKVTEKKVVAVGGGLVRTAATKVALRHGIVNVLVIDKDSAEALLQEDTPRRVSSKPPR